MWGGGTTEYALDALDAAVKGSHYTCPVNADEFLPMIHISDLISGMLLLMEAPEDRIPSACRGVAMAGFSFTPAILFDEIKKYYPSFSYSYDDKSNPSIALFSKTWPDTLSPVEAQECLGFTASKLLGDTMKNVIEGHVNRMS
jgi:nucleoside-diphosphate-sugar epimerase